MAGIPGGFILSLIGLATDQNKKPALVGVGVGLVVVLIFLFAALC
jgi:hypothetical protein